MIVEEQNNKNSQQQHIHTSSRPKNRCRGFFTPLLTFTTLHATYFIVRSLLHLAVAPANMSTKEAANQIDVTSIYDDATKLLQTDEKSRLARNLVSRMPLGDVLRDQAVANSYTYTYSDTLKTQGKATSQGSSGRCWIFACLNVLRLKLIQKFNLPLDFQLSQSYLFFFDKLERCQYFMDNIIDTVDQVKIHTTPTPTPTAAKLFASYFRQELTHICSLFM